jgi:hypothetical protein
VLGVVNGAIREATYGNRVAEQRAERVSGITLAAALAVYFWKLHRRWPIPTGGDAAKIGTSWIVLTVVFEFGLGRGVQKQSWREMLAAYNVAQGQTWPLVVAWIGAGPIVVRGLQTRGAPEALEAAGLGSRQSLAGHARYSVRLLRAVFRMASDDRFQPRY